MTAPPKVDGRNTRAANTKAALVEACREAMRAGCYRPPMFAVCVGAKVSNRSGFTHFQTVDALWREALADAATFQAVAAHILGPSTAATIPTFVVKRAVWATVLHERHQ